MSEWNWLSFVLGALAVTIVVVAWLWWAGRESADADLWTDPCRRGFQPTTQADEPRLPDGSEPVSGVQDPMATCPRCGLSVHMWDGRGCRCIIGDQPKVPPAPPLAPSATRSTIGRADRPKPQGNVLRKETER